MWRINAAASLLAVSIRGILERELFLNGDVVSGITVPVCVTEIALVAVLCVEQPFKWWVILIGLIIYFILPFILKTLLSSKHVYRLAGYYDNETIEKLESVVNVSALELIVTVLLIVFLSLEIHKLDSNKPWISLAFSILLAVLTLATTFQGKLSFLSSEGDNEKKNTSLENFDLQVAETSFNSDMGQSISQRVSRLRF